MSDSKSFSALARQALAESDMDPEIATDLLKKWCEHEETRDKAIDLACRYALRLARHHLRREIKSGSSAEERAPGADAGSAALVSKSGRTWLDWPLPSGVPLRRATSSDLSDACSTFYETEIGCRENRIWLRLVKSGLKSERQAVEERYDNEELEELRHQAEEQA